MSSYTGEPIPTAQMQEWLDATVERIRALEPKKMLEIGCGVGLLLQHLAPQCATYVGTDISRSALDQLRQWMSTRSDLAHVELLHRSATELQDLPAGAFDTVVLNSVVQYFPDIDYLLAVLQDAARLLAPGGTIFIGDVRHLGLQPVFHSAVQLAKAGATVSVGQLRQRVARAIAQEKELVIDPKFFHALPGHIPGVAAAEVQLKRGRAPNELTRYRYDVVLRTGKAIGDPPALETLEWQAAVGSAEALEAALIERRWRAVRLTAVPNARMAKEAAARHLIETSEAHLEAGALRRQLSGLAVEGIDPQDVWEWAHAQGYEVAPTWAAQDAGVCFDVQLRRSADANDRPPPVSETRRSDGESRSRERALRRATARPPNTARNWSTFANDPLAIGLRQRLIPELRDDLKARLPEYMIPSAWVVLRQLPLTPHGKVDRRALPAPGSRPEEMGEYVAPRTENERVLADMWRSLLQVDQVGTDDNFFELGGHSLIAAHFVALASARFNINLPVVAVFRSPTIRKMAQAMQLLETTKKDEVIVERVQFQEGVL
jgi:ubiquinone/menaquinone biosynthesis C-methylase UbiE